MQFILKTKKTTKFTSEYEIESSSKNIDKKKKNKMKNKNLKHNKSKINLNRNYIIKLIFILFLLLLTLIIFNKSNKNNYLVQPIETDKKENSYPKELIKQNKSNNTNNIINNNNYNNNKNKINNNNNNNNINNKNNYYACLVTTAKRENRYARDLIEYYLKLGVEKFVFADNNSPNTEKLSEVIQDYVDKGIVDIIDLIGVRTSPSEFFNDTCGKYNQKCEWFLFFDFDEYLEVFFEKNKPLKLKEFLSNETFDKCEAIVFNWLIYTDNELLYYDKRPLNERFTEPYFKMWSNIFVKAMIRGNLNKTLFVKGQSHHIPDKGLKICDSMGRIIRHNPYSVSPPVFEYGYLKHFSEKTADESSDKVLRGIFEGGYDAMERIKIFFATNKFSNEKLKIFEKKLNRTFDYNEISRSIHFRGNKGVNDD